MSMDSDAFCVSVACFFYKQIECLTQKITTMDNISIIVGVLLLAIFVVPVIWLNHRGKKNNNEEHSDTERKE